MSLSPETFWQLLSQSGLLSKKKIASVRAKIAQKESIANSSTKIARLLVANQLLTEKQAKRLLSGRSIGTNKQDVPKPSAAPPPVQSVSVDPKATTSEKADERTQTSAVLKKKSMLPIVLFTTLPLCLVVAGLVWFLFRPEQPPTRPDNQPSTSAARTTPQTSEDNAPYEFVESNEALWGREKPGQPVELKFAPAGVQTIVRLRLAELLSHKEGRKIIRSLGPGWEPQLESWCKRVGVESNSLKTLTLHLLPQGTTLPQYVVVAEVSSSRENMPSFQKRNDEDVAALATDAIWFPDDDQAQFIFGPAKIVDEIRTAALAGTPSILRRELEQLRKASHATDQVTLLANPNFLRDEAQGLFPNTRRRLLDGLYEFWSQDAQAISLGFQLSDVALAEARMIAREDLAPRHFAGLVERRLSELPTRTTDFLGQVELDSYWQRLALRFPAMVEFLTQQARVVTEGKQVAISVALPAQAVHNLLLASELSFASTLRNTDAAESVDRSQWTIDDVLASSINVRFAQKSLDIAMRDISQQVKDEFPGTPFAFSIEVVGTDLEPEGITRNQQIRDFESKDKTLAEALTALVMKANPDQSVTEARDPNQKLIWMPSNDTPGKILISTRAGAKNKGIELPSSFVE